METPSELEGFIFLYFLTENQILGSLGGILETSWAVLAKFLSRLGPQLGSILDPKMALELPKSRPRGAYRTPKRPLGAKNHPKAAQSPPKPPREVPRPPLSLDFRGSTVAGTRLCRAEDNCCNMCLSTHHTAAKGFCWTILTMAAPRMCL